MDEKTTDAALKRAIESAGGTQALARKWSLLESPHKPPSRQAIEQWKRCPAHRVLELARLTGVSREELRPDLYIETHV